MRNIELKYMNLKKAYRVQNQYVYAISELIDNLEKLL